jgi:hypothetical protein
VTRSGTQTVGQFYCLRSSFVHLIRMRARSCYDAPQGRVQIAVIAGCKQTGSTPGKEAIVTELDHAWGVDIQTIRPTVNVKTLQGTG